MKRIILLAFILALSVSGCAFSEETLIVRRGASEPNYDEEEGYRIPPYEFETLEEALEFADNPDEVEDPSTFTDVIIEVRTNLTLEDIITLSSYSNISTLTIRGSSSNITLTSPSESRHIIADNSSMTFTLSGIRLAGDSGGGVIISEGETVFTNVTFRECIATEDDDGNLNGGAVLITGTGSAAFTGCTFMSNSATNGGAVYASGAGSATFTGCTVESNTATNGGAIYASSTKTVSFTDTNIFSANYTDEGNGGAIYIASGQTLNFSGSTEFNANYTEEGNGGAIYVDGTGKITNNNATVIFDGNHTEYDTSEENTDDVSEIESGYGGAVCMAGSESIEFGTATFTNNRAVLGGALFIASVPSETNSSSFSAGMIYRPSFINSSGTITFTKGVSIRTGKAINGAAVFMSGGTITFTGSVEFTSNEATNHGGAFYVTGSSSALNFSEAPVFSQNKANTDNGNVGDGGAVWWGVDVSRFTSSFPASTTFKDNLTYGTAQTVSANAANGGAVYISQSGTLTIDKTTQYVFSGNTAYNNGGAIYAPTANIILSSLDITEANAATNGKGGFACTLEGDITVEGSGISSQTAKEGGAIYATNITITDNSVFSENNATGDGGAVYCNEGTLTVNSATFRGNNASGNGGAVITQNADVQIENAFFNSNTSNGQDGGAALYIYGQNSKTPQITQSTFRSNRSYAGDAGAILAEGGNVNITLSHFYGNYAKNNGGAISFTQSGGDSTIGEFNIKSSMFINNQGEGENGGAVYVRANYAMIDSCTFSENLLFGGDTDARGGGLYLETYDSVRTDPGTIQNCTFTGNQANSVSGQGLGGGLSANGPIIVRSCTFTLENKATTYGGGIYYENGRLTISATIVVGNRSDTLVNDDIYAGDSASKSSLGYNRMGFYSTNGTHSDFRGLDTDSEGGNTKNWTTATFFGGSAVLSRNKRSDTIPPRIGSSLDTEDTEVYLLTIMLNEDENLLEADRATNIIPRALYIRVPQYDERGVDRWASTADIDIGAVMYDGTTPGNPDEPITSYTIQSVTMSGIPNTLRSIGQTASLIALVRYTNGRTAYGGNDTGSEPVTWSSSNQQVVRIDQKGNITALATTPNNSYVTITVTTNRNTAGGTPATDSRPVRVLGQYSYLNISSVYQNYLAQYITELAEHDIAISLADVSASSVKSSSFQRAFKEAWIADKATQITDLTTSTPEFNTLTSYSATGYTPSKKAAANINFQSRSNGDVFPIVYSWTFTGDEIKALTGYDLSEKTLNANLADELFQTLRIDFQGAGKVFQVVGGSGVSGKDAYTNQALILTKADGNKGVKVELTAYLANVAATGSDNDGAQLMGAGSRKLLVVPDGTDDGAITGSMWMIQKGSNSPAPNTPNTPDTPNTPNNGNSESNSGSGSGGGGGCSSFSAGIALALVFMIKRKK